jgi:outer membrane protein assembly factor BamA
MLPVRVACVLLLLLVSPAWAQLVDPDALRAMQKDSTEVDAVPQRDIMDVFQEHVLHKRVEPQMSGNVGLQWSLLPTISYNPVYGTAIGVMVSGAGQRGSTKARYSNLAMSVNYSTTGQLQAQFRGDVFSPSGDYLLRTDVRYLDTERSTWGLGAIEPDQEAYPMSFVLTRVYVTLMRRMSGPVFIGLGYHLDSFTDIYDERAAAGEATPFTVYTNGAPTRTTASGFSINFLGDTRNNLVNASSGYYLNWSFHNFLESLGADNDWQELWVEARVYPRLPRKSKNVLAFWLYAWMTFGPAPYLNLPADGWDTYGRGARGYLQGRIRGVNQMYLESEYRFRITSDGLFGGVAFANLTCTADPETATLSDGDLGVGVGIRIKFNKNSDTNLAIDKGWGKEDSGGWFFGMTEAF